MTTLIGMIYDKGALLLADTQSTSGSRIISGTEKIYTADNNIIMTASGTVITRQKTFNWFKQELREYRQELNDYIKNEFDETIESLTKKERKEELEEFNSLNDAEKMLQVIGGEVMYIQRSDGFEAINVPRDIEGNIEYHLSSLVYQPTDKEVLLEPRIATEFYRELYLKESLGKDLNDESIETIIAGYGANGPEIYKVKPEGTIRSTQTGYQSSGSGSESAEPRIAEYYEQGLCLDKAMQLAAYCCLKANNEDIYTNGKMRIKTVEMDNGKVKIETVSQDIVDRIATAMTLARPKFPYEDF